MNNQQKYLLTGFGAAMAIILFMNAFTAFADTAAFWYVVFTVIGGTMMLLVLNIFLSTKTIAVRAQSNHIEETRKKR